MSRTRMTLAVGLVVLLAALAFAQGSEPSAPLPLAGRYDTVTTIALLDEPTLLSCNAGWQPVCVIRDGEQACACHPVPGVASGPRKPPAATPLPAATPEPPKVGPEYSVPPSPKLPIDTPVRAPMASNWISPLRQHPCAAPQAGAFMSRRPADPVRRSQCRLFAEIQPLHPDGLAHDHTRLFDIRRMDDPARAPVQGAVEASSQQRGVCVVQGLRR